MNTPIEQGEQGRWHKGAIADHYEADLARLRTEVETLRTRAEQAEANADHWHVAWDEATAQLVQAEAKAALADEAAQWAVSHQANPFDMQDWLARYDALEGGQRLTQAEAERDALRAKAALADEQYGEGKVRSHAYWKARYDAITAQAGEQHASNQP